jgi:uncharacterized protein YbaR (Trm112 family)
MHILLTDLLSCPRCGPDFGLVLRADRIEQRRVEEGRLGCPNCREQYPVRQGVVDLRAGSRLSAEPADEGEQPPAEADPGAAALTLAALLGLAEASGSVLLVGGSAAQAEEMAALLPEVEVVTLTPAASSLSWQAGSALLGGVPFPFRDHALRGVALRGPVDEEGLREALRTLHAGARLVLQAAPAGSGARLAALGAQLLLEQEDTVVARAPGTPVQLRLNTLR